MQQLSRKHVVRHFANYPRPVPAAAFHKQSSEINSDARKSRATRGSCQVIFILAPLLALALTATACAPTSTQTTETPIDWPIPTPSAVAKVSLLPFPYNAANVVNGRDLYRDCAGCHTLEKNGSETNGPNLHGVHGRRAAANGSYAYSEALRNSSIVWDLPHLNQWLFNPHEALPGTSMAYIGIRNDAKRRDLIVYLIAASATDVAETNSPARMDSLPQ